MLRKLPDKISRFLIYLTAFGVSALMAIMLIHIIKESIPAFSELGIKMFLPSTEWRPVSANPQFGLLPAITGTLYVSFIAVVLALIFGVACACFLNFYLPEKIAAVFLAFIDLVAGIPSVIFGFIGLTVLVKSFATQFHMAAGQCILAAGIVLAIMLLPFVISTCHESIRVARTQYELTALALGFSREITLVKIIFSGNPPRHRCRSYDGFRACTWRNYGSYDGHWKFSDLPETSRSWSDLAFPDCTGNGKYRVRQSPSVRTLCCKCCVTGHFAGRIGNRLSFEEEVRKT